MRARGRRAAAGARARWERSLGGHGWARMRELDLGTHALALCAQQVLCAAPLAVAMSAVLQRVDGRNIGHYLTKLFDLKRDSASAVTHQFAASAASISTGALVVSMIVSIALSTSLGAVQQRAFELIWALPGTRGLRATARLLVWTAVLAGYLAGLVAVTRWGRDLGHLYGANVLTSNVFEGALTAAFYWWSQRWLLVGRVAWRALLPGAIAVGLVTAVVLRVSREIVPGQISWQVHAYGPIGALFVLSVWLMVLSSVIFGGVLLGALLAQRRTAPPPATVPV